MNDQPFLQFDDLQEYVATRLGSEGWITVYEYTESDRQKIGYYCALVAPDAVSRCLENTSWDLLIGHGMPGFSFYPDGTHRYYRFGDDDGVEPFIIDRDFHGLKPSYKELSEEFRHFHNLYEDRRAGVFIALDDNGDDVEVVRTTPKRVQVRAKYLKDYLAARGMHMLLFFEFDRWSEKSLGELGMEKQDEKRQESDYRYSRWVAPWEGVTNPSRKTFARIIGKKVIKGTENYRPSMGWGRENQQYEDFIIGVDDDGNEVHYTSDEEQLANYFGKNPGSPHYLTPVFFRKSVMAKYYNDPAKYRVEDGHVYCGGYWSLRLDNSHRDYVIVYLGDLGKLSHKEQLYWKSFNVLPDGGVSDVAFRRGILGEWADTDEPALSFKANYERFRDGWRKKHGWDLFKPLKPEDEHYWGTLHVPASENQKEFDDQVMALAKLLVERLNEREVAKYITVGPNEKGIAKFEKYLEAIGFPDRQRFITLLRNLNGLRSGPAHVKGRDYQRAAQHFDLEGKGLSHAISGLLVEATAMLVLLGSFSHQREPAKDDE
ncbi:hypothetical protein KIF24_24135 [Micromonospora sp. Llam7]|uniref:hypothetical protein n=1 Tax=Micromonospora tarapacensis TaxID=2835305 RepID=UPI001C832036|nr:hypothetical protein [Micromonospora tarapacensis]MBX7268802.1 hypothetical protein [Micromonospora tarapacensis]